MRLFKRARRRGVCKISQDGASTNNKGWSMQDVWNWGNEAREFVKTQNPKQKIKYGNTTIMLSKKEPIDAVFAIDVM